MERNDTGRMAVCVDFVEELERMDSNDFDRMKSNMKCYYENSRRNSEFVESVFKAAEQEFPHLRKR